MSLSAEKAAARKAGFARRAAAFAAGQAGAVARLNTVLPTGRVLAGYLPIRTEIDPVPAMAVHDGPVCVPRVAGPDRALEFHAWRPGVALAEEAFGTLVPLVRCAVVPEVLIVPLLAFDRAGYRLGYGGGFYDRTLEGLRASGPVLAVGFAFAAQEVAAVPREATDQPLDMIVTEREVIRPRPVGDAPR